MRSRRGLCSVVVLGHDHRAGALTAVSIIAALVDTSLLRRKPPRSGRGPLPLPHTTTRAAGGPTTTRPAPGHVVPTLGRDVADPGRGRGQRARRRRREERSPSTRFRTRRLVTGTAARQSLETVGAGISASWPNVVPLGRPFKVREPVWRWGLGLARPGANRQRQDRRHRRSRQPADRRVRRFGGGQAGQADTQLATAPAAASRRRTRISHQDRRYWQKPTTRNPRLCRPRPVPPQVYKG